MSNRNFIIIIGIMYFLMTLTGCATVNPVINLQKPDPSIMESCSELKAKFKEGMTTIDIAGLVLEERKLKQDCSILNEKKKAFINSLFE